MKSNFSESKFNYIKPAFPFFVTDYRDGKRHRIEYWSVSDPNGTGCVFPVIEVDGALVEARGHYSMGTDEEGLVAPAYLDQHRALREVQEVLQ